MQFADGKYVVKTVSQFKHLGGGRDILEVTFENREGSAYTFDVYADVLTYLNQEVEVTFRQEIIEGSVRPVINNLVVVKTVMTLDKDHDVKLYITDMPDTASNINFNDLELNQTVTGAILYCTHQKYDASKKADWADLTVQDKKRSSLSLKLFSPDTRMIDFAGRYIRADIKYTKYGLNTYDIEPVEGLVAPPNPEIEVAKAYILSATEKDNLLTEFMTRSGIINSMSTYIDREEPEIGYILIRTALELEEVLDYKNTSPIIDVPTMIRAIILRKGYVLTNTEDHTLSKEVQNTLALSSYGPQMMTKLMLNMIAEKPRVELLEWKLLNLKQEAVDVMVKARKYRTHVLSTDKIWGQKK